MNVRPSVRLTFPTLAGRWSVLFFGVCGLAAPCLVSPQGPTSAPDIVQISDGVDLPVREHVLSNGMRFLLLQRPGAPTVSFVAHVPIGSVNEPPGRTGISHVLEHLLFKGTTTIGTRDLAAEQALFQEMDAAHDSIVATRAAGGPDAGEIGRLAARISALEDSARVFVIPNEYHQILAQNGARGPNATTSYEATQYFVSLPSNRAELWFALEADRMRNPVFREFFSEKDVVSEERRTRIETSPSGFLSVAQLETAFQVHPYGRPPIGRPEDVRSLSRAEVRDYHQRYYGPQNTTVAMVGQFEPDSAIAWADRYFGSIERGESTPPPPTPEPTQSSERRVEVLRDAEAQLRVSWKISASTDEESPVLAILANILVGSADARLHRRLVREERIASSVFAGTGPGSLYPGLFTIQATPRGEHTPEEVEATIYDELERLRRVPPTEDEIARVRTGLEAARARRLTSPEGLAFQLVSSQAQFGDWRETFRFQERMRTVTPEDVVEALNRFLTESGRTVATLRPDPGA